MKIAVVFFLVAVTGHSAKVPNGVALTDCLTEVLKKARDIALDTFILCGADKKDQKFVTDEQWINVLSRIKESSKKCGPVLNVPETRPDLVGSPARSVIYEDVAPRLEAAYGKDMMDAVHTVVQTVITVDCLPQILGEQLTQLAENLDDFCDGSQDLTVKEVKEIVNKVHCLMDKKALRRLNKDIDKLTGDIVDPKGNVGDFLNKNLCPVFELLDPLITNSTLNELST
ncbi:uncharacterized protein RB166_009442 [Leptodactylus fuscus]|uniref:uncharacterized protein LOC142204133 n=1 Tax=Leptodactylus fuscus TaxID=238119 RepID=UPI003F4E7759